MTYIRWPKCGHRRCAANTSKKGTCRACMANVMRAATRAKKPKRNYWLRCDHPRTPENTVAPGKAAKERCKTCYEAYHRGLRKESLYAARRFDLRDYVPRPLPVVDTSGRSYSVFPPKYQGAA